MLHSGKPDMPFCLCWANENWTRRWDGRDNEILIGQEHSDEDDTAVMHDLIRYFRSSHYIRIDGKPLLLIYRVTLFPDFRRTSELWREQCRREGIGEIYLAMVGSFEQNGGPLVTPEKFGCDAMVEFPPHGGAKHCKPTGEIVNPAFNGQTFDYRDYAVWSANRPMPPFPYFRSAMPSWDNTARRQNDSHIFVNSSPGDFQAWLERICQLTHEHNSPSERFVFINAWNEWAEGAYLEPDLQFGHSYLEAVRNARDAWMRK
jgi:lipopolysaccharide biosynthesis protein